MRIALRTSLTIAVAGVCLAGGPEPAIAASEPWSHGPRDSLASRVWSVGFSAALVRRGSDVHGRLFAELERQGWGDDTPDQFIYGVFVPAQAYPYKDSPTPSALRVWVDRAFRARLALRGELSLPTSLLLHGHRNDFGILDLNISDYSFALMPMFGGALRAGGGPSLDIVTTEDTFGDGVWKPAPGLTLVVECAVYRMGKIGVGVVGGWHAVSVRDLDGGHSIKGGPHFRTGTLDLSYGHLGLSFYTTRAH